MMKDKHGMFWELAEPEHLKARAFCRKLIGNRDEGDDLYQDALVTAMVNFASLRDQKMFKSWLYRIIVNRFKNNIRRPFWKKLVPLSSDSIGSDQSHDPSALFAARQSIKIAFKAVAPEERALITLFEIDGWSIKELAAMSNRSEGNIKVRLSRARKKMRQALEKQTVVNKTLKNRKLITSEAKICVAAKQGKD